MTQAECEQLNYLWETQFNACCPFFMDLPQYALYPQATLNDVRGKGTFPAAIGQPFGVVKATKWIGHVGGCKLFWEWFVVPNLFAFYTFVLQKRC